MKALLILVAGYVVFGWAGVLAVAVCMALMFLIAR